MSRALFLINSPLQALCAIEYSEKFGVKCSDYYIVANTERDTVPIKKLLDSRHITYKAFEISGIFKCLRMIPKYNPKYDLVVMGEYFGINMRIFAFLFGKRKIQWIYLDDGSSSLEMKNGVKANMSFHHRVLFKAVRFLQRFWHVDELFFSAFLNKDDYPELKIIDNDFSGLFKNNKLCSEERWVVVVGSYINEFKRVGKDYIRFLERADNYIKTHYPDSRISYFPHRYEDDLDKITQFCNNHQWEMIIPDINIEIEIFDGGVKPSAIIGFGSSALFTLKRLLIDVPVATYEYMDGDSWDEYQKHGIDILK